VARFEADFLLEKRENFVHVLLQKVAVGVRTLDVFQAVSRRLSVDLPSRIFAPQNGLRQSNNFSNKLLLLISRFETYSPNNMFLKSLSQVLNLSIQNSKPQSLTS
jgi:hypothetical protein